MARKKQGTANKKPGTARKNKKQATTGKKHAAAGKKQAAAGKKQAAAGRKQAAAGRKHVAAGRKQAAAGRKQAAAGRKQAAAGRKQAAAGRKQAAAGRKQKTALRGMATLKVNHYRPSEGEDFMNDRMTEYFRGKLLQWRSDLLQESSETLLHLQESSTSEPDLADRASLETDRSLELRTRDRERKLLAKIDAALARIEDGTYGYCEETMEPISIRRLEARPIATLSIEAQERHERMERTHRDE